IIIRDIEQLKSDISSLENKKFDLEILKVKEKDIEKAMKKLSETQKTRENLEKDISLLAKHTDSLKESILSFSKYNNLFKLKQEELKKAFKSEKEGEISLAELKKES